MKISELISNCRTEKRTANAEIERILETVKREKRGNLTEAESVRTDELFEDIARLNDKLERLEAIAAEDAEYEARAQETVPANLPKRNGKTASVRVTSEPRTYRAQSERGTDVRGNPEPGFISDLYRAQILNDPQASERLARHGREMAVDNPALVERAVSSSGVPGFVPPQYLVDMFAEFARAGRPTANLCRRMPLPEFGLTVNIPRLTTASATGIQASENATVANNDPAATLLTANVNTVAGYVVVSRQVMERGPLSEEIIGSDLAADYNAKLDLQVLNGSGSSGQHLGILNVSGINAVTYTAASPVLVGATTPMWPKLASAIGQVMSGRFAGPSAIVMSPTEWVWMLAATDANNRPVVQPNTGAYQPAGLYDGAPGYDGVAGYLFNLPVVLSAYPEVLRVTRCETGSEGR